MEPTRTPVRAARAVAGLLGLVALAGVLIVSNDAPGFTAANFFSYFTVESNVLAMVVLLGLAGVPEAAAPTDGLRGATTVYMVITGVVYNVLLRGIDVGLPSSTFGAVCNELLHVVLPLLVLADWLLVPPLRVIGRRRALLFLLFPLVYLGYTLARGALVGWYPYPFLDPGPHGYGRVALVALVIAVGMLAVSLAVEQLGRRHGQEAAPHADL